VKYTTAAWDKVWNVTRALHTAATVAEAKDKDKLQAIDEAKIAVQVAVADWQETTKRSEAAAAYEVWANIFQQAPTSWDAAVTPSEAAYLPADHSHMVMPLTQEATHLTDAAQETVTKAVQAWNEANANILVVARHHIRSTFAEVLVKVASVTEVVNEATTAMGKAQTLPGVSWSKRTHVVAENELKVTEEAYDKITETIRALHAAYSVIQALAHHQGETWQVAHQTAKASLKGWKEASTATETAIETWRHTSTQSDPAQLDWCAGHTSISIATNLADKAVKAVSQAAQSWEKANSEILLAISNTNLRNAHESSREDN
jgi:hypothetical protein